MSRTIRIVLVWALGIAGFICSLPFLLWGNFRLSYAIASLFYYPRSEDHAVLCFCLAFGTVVTVGHGAPFLWMWWSRRRQQQRAQAAQRSRNRHPGTSVPPVGTSTASVPAKSTALFFPGQSGPVAE